jgi:hypothetical protein
MQRLVNIPEYWTVPADERPTTFAAMIALLQQQHKDISGHWMRQSTDARTGEVLDEVWSHNVITDNGGMAAIKNAFAATGSTIGVFNVMAIAQDAGSCKVGAGGISAGTPTTLTITGLGANLSNGSQVIAGYGIANATTFTLGASASSGATSLTVSGGTVPSGGIPAGADIVPVALATDNPGSLSSAAYLALTSPDFVYTAGSGSGNRTVTVTKKFPGASTTAGTYTSARLSNANPVASGSVGATLFLPQATINSTTDQTYVFVIKI